MKPSRTRKRTKAQRPGIPCPGCGSSDNDVLRTTASSGYIVRRRECSTCRKRITTVERPIQEPNATGSGLLQISIGQIRESLDLLADLAGGISAEPQNDPEPKGT